MIKNSKAIKAKDTKVGKIYKLDGVYEYYMRVTFCGSVREEGEKNLFVTMIGDNGIIVSFHDGVLFKPVDADLTIDD